MIKLLRRYVWIHLVVIVLALAAFGDSAIAQGPKRSHNLLKLDGWLKATVDSRTTQVQRVIIRVQPGTLSSVRSLLTSHGDNVLAEHGAIDALTVIVHADDLAALDAGQSIISVSTDAVIRAKGGLLGGLLGVVVETVGTVVDTVVSVASLLVNTGGTLLDPAECYGPAVPPRVLRETLGLSGSLSGKGVGVAVIDSGLEMSDEFHGRVSAFYDFTGGKTAQATPSDAFGHGTHVAGTIGGSGALSNNREYRGLAPNVKFVILKALDANGAGYTSDVIRAIDFAVANRAKWGIHIINLSLGHPIFEPAETDPLVQAVERATRAGVIVIAAAGNLGRNPQTGLPGYAGITSPGNAPSAITVGALRTDDTVARGDDRIPDYSSAGPTWYDARVKPDVVAPGHNIVAAAARRGYLYKTYPYLKAADGDYMRLSGTSMATAVASGVVALALEAHRSTAGWNAPRPTPNAVKAALMYTAIAVRTDVGIEDDRLRQGSGALNGKGAIELTRGLDTTKPEGAPWLNPAPAPWTVIASVWLPWRQEIIWNTGVIWGSTVDVNQKAWGAGVIWGSANAWDDDDGVIWGSTDLVWSDSYTWSSGVIWGSSSVGTVEGEGVIWGSNDGMTRENAAFADLSP
jgi:serine protease AprX